MRVLTRLLVLNHPAPDAACAALNDPDPTARLQGARLATRFPDASCVPGLLKAACGADMRVLNAALDALARHGALLALAAAVRLEELGSAEASLAAVRVLKPYRGGDFGTVVAKAIKEYPADYPPPERADLARLLEKTSSAARDGLAARKLPWLRWALVDADAKRPPGDPGAVRRLTRISSDPDEALRAAAADALEYHDKAEPGTVLAPLLKHEYPDMRRRAIEGLGRAGPRALRLLRHFLGDEDATLRRATYDALAQLLPDDQIKLWARGLQDPNPHLAEWSLQRLVELPDGDEARRALVRVAREEEGALRANAVKALAARDVCLLSLARKYATTSREALDGICAAAFEPAELIPVVRAVGILAPYDFLGLLVQAVSHKSATVRRAAADAILLHKHTRQGHEAMAMLAGTRDPDILRRVAFTLAESKDPRGVFPLLRAMEECRSARDALEPLLAHYPETGKLRFLLRALREPFASIKRFALKALLDIDSPEMVEPLLQATKDPDPEIRRAALQALNKFSKHPQVYKRLMEIRDATGDEQLRQDAVATLLGVDAPSVIQPLLEATREDDVEVQMASVQALGKFATRPEVAKRLMEMIEFGDTSVREAAVRTLGVNKVACAVPELIRFIGNPFLGPRVREALYAIGDRKGILAIKRHQLRARLYGKKKSKGPVQPLRRKVPGTVGGRRK